MTSSHSCIIFKFQYCCLIRLQHQYNPHTRLSVNPLYRQVVILKFADNIKLSNFLFAHDSIKCNLPTSLCDSITLVNNKHSHTSRNQEANQVNIPTVRTKTSGSNSIKSKSANIWNYLKLFHSEQLIHQKRSFCKSLLTGYFIKGYV